MTTARQFIGMSPWWNSRAGRHLLEWEQGWLDESVADVFGFHALQLGLPGLGALRANRMPHRWLACSSASNVSVAELNPLQEVAVSAVESGTVPAECLRCEYDALPFASHSLDLVVMPHTLELARDPHLALREAERVLVPEGRLVITAFNPARWWVPHKAMPRAPVGGADLGRSEVPLPGRHLPQALAWPARADMLGFRRLRDWLRLLSFEVEAARFGRFGPRLESVVWQQRWSWIEPVGQRWWPVFGAVYGLTAVKRVRGMRLVGLAKRQARYASAPRSALVTSQHGSSRSRSTGDEV